MAYTIPTGEPTVLHIGSDWEWDAHYSSTRPSEGYTLRYELHGPEDIAEIVAATSPDGDYFEVRVARATTAQVEKTGTYVLIGYVTDGSDVRPPPVYYREVELRADPAADPQPNKLTQDEQELALVDAALLTLAEFPEAVSQVYSRRTEFKDHRELARRQGMLRAKIARARRGGSFQRAKVAFRAPA